MLCNFSIVKNHKIAKNSTTALAIKKYAQIWNPQNFKKYFDACLTKFKNNQILLNKISHRFLTTSYLFTVLNIPIKKCKSLPQRFSYLPH
jgi:hypothetical protein